MAHDASHFRLAPTVVVRAHDTAQVAATIAAAAAQRTPVCFRSGGTSLSGQSLTDGVLIDTRSHFRGIEVLDDGRRVRVGPGETLRAVNTVLARHGRRLGPDPASEIACTVGGMVANNSSGMSCGTAANTYQTLDAMTVVLTSGAVIDTGRPDADARLRAEDPGLHEGLLRLRRRVLDDPASVRTIKRLFSLKNTMGYGLNALLDFDTPVDILAHLVVGSEGTLAFIASVTLRTVPLLPHASTGLLLFDGLGPATASIPALVETRAATIELMDAASLRAASRDPSAAPFLPPPEGHQAALLVEYQADTVAALAAATAAATATLTGLPTITAVELTDDAASRARMWKVRKGLYATVAGNRPPGSTALLEDVVVPVPALLDTCQSLTDLFHQHGYGDDCVIFGHAKDGNLHFMLAEQFGGESTGHTGVARIEAFTEDLVQLILGQQGSLKAEHGTGRMMAPYVRRQYGAELFDVMTEIKRLFDPAAVLNPGVVLTDDASAHLRDLKVAPRVEEEVDRCVECGFCEPVCPSRMLTTTPRQRIALRREMQRAELAGDTATLEELRNDYRYAAVDTCAVDGMCQTSCPVLINTGDLVRRLRQEQAEPGVDRTWRVAAKNWGPTTRMASAALTIARRAPKPVVIGTTNLLRRAFGEDTVPAWSPDLPRGMKRRKGAPRPGRAPSASPIPAVDKDVAPAAVFFEACVGRIFGPAADGPGSSAAVHALFARAGLPLAVVDANPDLCCGTPWKSKGLSVGYRLMQEKTMRALWAATNHGTMPVIVDASSCAEGVLEMVKTWEPAAGADLPAGPVRLQVHDAGQFIAHNVLPRLTIRRRLDRLALHPTCSSTRMGINEGLRSLAAAVARVVNVADDWGCCAFAGDRGMLHPELTEAATRAEAAALSAREYDAYASSNRTCELGMTRATGREFQHVLELLDWATRYPE